MVDEAVTARGLLGGDARRRRDGALDDRRYDPGHDAAVRYPDWVVRHRALHGPRELLSWRRRVILIDSEQSWPAKRCSLAHALAHLDLEHSAWPTMSAFEAREEAAADLLAARRLISLDELLHLAPWTQHPAEMLDELDVDADILRARLAHLHPSERGQLRRVLSRREDGC